MKYLAYGLVLLLALVFQTAGVPGVVLFGVKPELVLLVVLLFAMILEPQQAAVLGFAGGLFQDLLVGRFITLSAASFTLVALAVALAFQRFYGENPLVRLVALVGGTAVGELLYLFGAASFGLSRTWTWGILLPIFTASLFNGVVGLLLFRPFVKLNKRVVYLDELLKRTG